MMFLRQIKTENSGILKLVTDFEVLYVESECCRPGRAFRGNLLEMWGLKRLSDLAKVIGLTIKRKATLGSRTFFL